MEYSGIQFELVRKPIKNMYLRICPTSGQIKISAPLKWPEERIHTFITQKQHWIKIHQTRILNQMTTTLSKTLITDEIIYFLGEPYTLILHEQSGPTRFTILDSQLHFYLKPNTTYEHRLKLLQHWYKVKMHELLPALIKKWEMIMGVNIQQYQIRCMKTRWGSCNILHKRITINLKLMEKSIGCLESVIVHELVHLFEARHNKRFYALMTKFMPNWKDYKQELN